MTDSPFNGCPWTLERTSPCSRPFATIRPGPGLVRPVNRLDSFFDRVFGDDGHSAGQAWAGVPLSMWQDEDHIFVEVELPGVAESDLEMTVHNGMLFIRGERKAAEGRRPMYDGRSYGRFERVVTLPAPSTPKVPGRICLAGSSTRLPQKPRGQAQADRGRGELRRRGRGLRPGLPPRVPGRLGT